VNGHPLTDGRGNARRCCAVIEKPPFEVSETGWGEFEIQIKIFFVAEAAEKVISVSHLLKLHPRTVDNNGIVVAVPPGTPIAATATAAATTAGGTGTDPAVAAAAAAAAATTGLDVSSVHSWQFDEVVFNDPTEALYNIMVQNPPTPLWVITPGEHP
jgi:YEATS domain-containing protein 4